MRPPSRVIIAILKPSPSWPSRFSPGTFHIVEDQLRRGRRADPQLVVVVAEVEAGPALSTIKAEMPWVPISRRGHGEDHIGIGLRSVGDKDLAPLSR